MNKLSAADRRRAADCYGDSIARYYVDGRYYTEVGEEVPLGLVGLPAEEAEAQMGAVREAAGQAESQRMAAEQAAAERRALARLKEEEAERVAAVTRAAEHANPDQHDPMEAIADELSAAESEGELRELLRDLDYRLLAKLVTAIGQEPAQGEGAKAINTQALVDAWLAEQPQAAAQ